MFSNDDDDTNNSIPIKKKAKTVPKYFQESWLEDPNLKLFIEKCKDPTKRRCKICDKEMASGKSELEKHAEGKKHKEKMKCIKMQKPITSYTSSINVSHEMKVKTAEIKLAAFFAEHNLAIHVIEHLMPLLKNIFDDSKVAQDINMKRTKCTEIIKNVIAKTEVDNIVKELKCNKFSILIDESTDLSTEKHLCILVKYCGTEPGKVVTTLLKLVKLNATLNKYQVPLANIIGLASDNCNTMTGMHNSFYTHLKKDVPNAILVPCICHSAAIIASKACEELPRSPEELLRATYSYISSSSKRCSVLNEIQDFFYLEKKKILKFSTTRWLSRHQCVMRILHNYQALAHYFQLAVYEDKLLSAEQILALYNNVCNKIYLLFLKYVLNIFNSFNALFQLREPQIHVLYTESNFILKQICQNFIQMKYIMNQSLGKLNVKDSRIYLSLEEIYLGNECNLLLRTIPHETSRDIYINCLNFYIRSAEEIQKRLPINQDMFSELSIISPDVALTERNLKTSFPLLIKHVSLYTHIDVDNIEQEWRDLNLLDGAKKEEMKVLPVDELWHCIYIIKRCNNERPFINIALLAQFILSLPHSNADAERVFSIVSDLKTKKRNKIGNESLSAMCIIRTAFQNKNINCYNYSVSNHVIKMLKSNNLYSFKKSD